MNPVYYHDTYGFNGEGLNRRYLLYRNESRTPSFFSHNALYGKLRW